MARLESTQQLRTEWGPACGSDDMVTLHLTASDDGARITVRRAAADAFRAIDTVMAAHDFHVPKASTGAFACRQITNGTGMSLHAFGIAADYWWTENPFGPKLVTNMPAGMVADIKAISTRNGVRVFRWGGDYRKNKDAMHYEVVAQRADLAAGIDPASVAGEGFEPTTGTVASLQLAGGVSSRPRLHLMKPRMRGEGVKRLQGLLVCSGLGVEVDGFFGPATEAAVLDYQRRRGLEADGWVGPVTWQRLEGDCAA